MDFEPQYWKSDLQLNFFAEMELAFHLMEAATDTRDTFDTVHMSNEFPTVPATELENPPLACTMILYLIKREVI